MSTTPTEMMETTALEAMLDLDSIKAVMDGFDPASLLPDLEGIFSALPGICRFAVMIGPLLFLALGLSCLFLAPKEANYYLGYRCYFGMGSEYAWRFTQRFAGMLFTTAGGILTITVFVISSRFAHMEVTDMVWKALSCALVEAAAALVLTLFINLTTALRFNRKGNHRRKSRR